MKNPFQKFFLAANSCEGFVSQFSSAYSVYDGWHALLIKGGPGTGKSSFMKYMVSKAQRGGYDVIMCPCSSDPQSLDGVIIPEKKTVLLDATAPHTVDPVCPGVCEEIIDLGKFWNREKLVEHKDEIIVLSAKNKSLHRSVSRILSAAGELFSDDLQTGRSLLHGERINTYADTLCRRYFKRKTGRRGTEQIRFIQGVTPVGVVGYPSSITDFYKETVIIEDRIGAASDAILKAVRERALFSGYNIITLKNPFLPSEKLDHIIVPELSLCFATENELLHFDSDIRRCHSRRFIDAAAMRKYHTRFSFNRRVRRELLLSACETLARAKDVHDELENYYKSAMDFSGITAFAEKTAKEIF